MTNLIEQCKAYIERIEKLRLRNMIADQTWVVVSAHGFPTAFDFTDLADGRRQAAAARSCSLPEAPCFTRHDAETLAGHCIDGTGQRSVAMFINDVIDLQQQQQREVITQLEAV